MGPPTLEAIILANEHALNHREVLQPPKHHNISKDERAAISELFLNPNIVLRSADKGSSICVLNLKDYVKHGLEQLSNTKYYKKVDIDLTSHYNKEIQDFIL